MFRALCGHHQEVKIVLYSIWYRHICRWLSGAQLRKDSLNLSTGRTPTECDDTRCCIIQFWPSSWWAQQCSKHVEEYNKLIIKQEFVQ